MDMLIVKDFKFDEITTLNLSKTGIMPFFVKIVNFFILLQKEKYFYQRTLNYAKENKTKHFQNFPFFRKLME